MKTLLEEIIEKCPAELIAAQEHGQIAAIVSAGRTQPSRAEIGNGTILAVLGLAAGNAMLDAINNSADFRYVKPLVEQGRLTAGSPMVAMAIASLVAVGVITQADADKFAPVLTEPAPVSVPDVIEAMKGA